MHAIGIITGSGPNAGIDIWQKMLSRNIELLGNNFSGDTDHPEFRIISIPELGKSMKLKEHETQVWNALEESIISISSSTECFIIACNTLHYFEDRIKSLVIKSKFISFVDVLEEYLKRNGYNEIAILGVSTVTEASSFSPYFRLRDKFKIEIFSSSLSLHFQIISQSIKKENLTSNITRTMEHALSLVKSDVCILACTEFPLLNVVNSSKTLVDLNKLVANYIIDQYHNPSE